MKCDGCRAELDMSDEGSWMGHNDNGEWKWYHLPCWQTGWYTGIEPKGEWPVSVEADPVNAPAHYRWLPNGIEVIDITESFNFLLGNVLKYVMRADHKGKPLEDLEKAAWYLEREIANRKNSGVV